MILVEEEYIQSSIYFSERFLLVLWSFASHEEQSSPWRIWLLYSYGEIEDLGSWNWLLKISIHLKTCLASFCLSRGCLISAPHTELLSGSTEGQDLTLAKVDHKCQFSVDTYEECNTNISIILVSELNHKLFPLFIYYLSESTDNIFYAFYTVHEVLMANILGWFAIPSSSERAGLRLKKQLRSWQWSHYCMASRRGKGGSSDRLPFWGLQNHCGRWLQPWIRRGLLLGRKAMTNLDRVLKSRNITLQTKVHIVKAIVFQVVAYSCKSRTLKKVEHRRIDAFELWGWKRLLKFPWTTISNKSILREINPEYSLEGLILKLKLQYFGLLMPTDDSLEKSLMLGKTEGRRRRGGQKMRWLDSIDSAVNMNLGKLWEMVRDRETWHAAVHRIAKSQTQLGDWTPITDNMLETYIKIYIYTNPK